MSKRQNKIKGVIAEGKELTEYRNNMITELIIRTPKNSTDVAANLIKITKLKSPSQVDAKGERGETRQLWIK